MLAALTLPPYCSRNEPDAFGPQISFTCARIAPMTACASDEVAVRPVPIAHMGS